MLDNIKQSIIDLPDKPFKDFYQEYISDLEDDIIAYDIEKANSRFRSIEDITDIVKGINQLTEELR